ncbi:MAG: serine/threonine protein kinase, partial [Planctomycetota bacterium]
MSVRLDDKLTRVYEPGTAVGSSVVESVGARELLFRLSGVEPFCATQLLDMYPHLWQSREDVLLLAAEEFARRRLAGESISPDAFADQFRQWRDAVRREVEIERRVAAYESDTDGPDVAWPRPGARFLHYEIVRLIGRGGFSRVYLARNLNLGGRRVVLKLCPSESTDEARTLGSLQHPNIGDVLSMDVDPQRGLTAICMPFCSLATLADVVAAVQHHRDTTGRMPRRAGFLLQTVRHVHDEADVECPDDSAGLAAGQRWIASHGFVDGVLEIGRQLATALAVTHRRKLLHRDIKPSNVLITPSGRAILFDFNLSSDCDQITNVAGTFAYMAPEALKVVARRTRLVSTEYDVRSDLYSLGATLYELLAGRHPFDRTPPHLSHQAAAELLLEKQALGPRPLHEVNTAVDRQVSCVVERLLAFDPAERFQTADELLETLNDLLRPTVKLRRSWQSRPALRIGTAGVAVAVSLFVAGTVVTWYRPFPPDANLPHVAARSTTPVASPRGPLAGAATPGPGPQNVRQTTAAERNRSIDRADQQHPTAATTSPLPRPMLVADQVPPASVAAGVHLAELSKTSAESDNPDAPAVVSSSERSADARPAVPTADGARKPTSPASAPRADAATEPAPPADGAPPKPVVVLTAQNTEATAGDAHRTPPASPGKLPKDESAQSARHEEPEAGRKELAIRITAPARGSIGLPNARRIGRSPADGTD